MIRSGWYRGFMAVLFIVVLISAIRALQGPAASDFWRGVGAAFFALMLVGFGRQLFLGIVVTSRGVTVRNSFRTHDIPWTEIARFYVAPGSFSPEAPWVETIDSRKIAIHGLTSWARWADPESAGQVHVWMDELNAERTNRCAA